MPATLGFAQVLVGSLMSGFGLFPAREPAVAVSSLPAEYRQLLREELGAFGGGDVPLSKLHDMLVKAAARFQAERQAVEARAAQREAQNKARLDAELARRIEAYKKHVPNEIQIIALQIIEAETRAKAEAEADIPKLKASIERLEEDKRSLSTSLHQLEGELRAAKGKNADLAGLRASVAELSAETGRLREELGKSTAEARRASADTSELRGQVTTLSAAKAALERRLRETGREREQLVRVLEGAAAGPLAWRVTPPPGFGGSWRP